MAFSKKNSKKKVVNDPKIIAHALRKAWRNSQENENLEIIVSGTERSRDVLGAMISPYASINHVIENAGIISFNTDYAFANSMLDAWLGENNRLFRDYKSTFNGINAIEPSMQLHHCATKRTIKRTTLDTEDIDSLLVTDNLESKPERGKRTKLNNDNLENMWNLRMVGAYDAQE
jgi:Zn-dependent oligopeptidase